MKKTFGNLVTEQRLALGYTLREFCLKNEINSTVLSKIETGVQLPKKNEMPLFIEALKIYEGSAEHAELLEAYSCFVPDNEFTCKDLPVFIKPDTDLDKLIDFLKESKKPGDQKLFNN